MLHVRIAACLRNCSACALLCLALEAAAQPQGPVVVPHAALPPLRDVSTADYRAHLDALRQLVADCARVITACDAARVGDDDRVHPASGPPYTERYIWLRNLMEDRNDSDHKLRRQMLPRAEQRLAEQEAELDDPPHDPPITDAQRAARAAVLRRSEFRTDQGYSLSERVSAWIDAQFMKFFGGVSALGRTAPWLGTAVEWAAVVGALVLLLLWVYRTLDRQRVALGKLSGDGIREAALAESRAWVAQAKAHAERGAWRDAVHALYWASIVVLEDRRTLRRSSTRTPREALKLVDVSSQAGALLQAQTSSFERIWYGFQPASAADYEAALRHYEALQTARAQAVTA